MWGVGAPERTPCTLVFSKRRKWAISKISAHEGGDNIGSRFRIREPSWRNSWNLLISQLLFPCATATHVLHYYVRVSFVHLFVDVQTIFVLHAATRVDRIERSYDDQTSWHRFSCCAQQCFDSSTPQPRATCPIVTCEH